MKKNLDITNLILAKILSVPWLFAKTRFHCIFKNATCISMLQIGMEDPTNCDCELHQDIRGF